MAILSQKLNKHCLILERHAKQQYQYANSKR